jgi:3-isopropylmalate dehydrogenase
MMLKYSFGYEKEANFIEEAVTQVLNDGLRTQDIAKPNENTVSCSQMTDKVIAKLKEIMAK